MLEYMEYLNVFVISKRNIMLKCFFDEGDRIFKDEWLSCEIIMWLFKSNKLLYEIFSI